MQEDDDLRAKFTDAIGKIDDLDVGAELAADIRESELPDGTKRWLLGRLTIKIDGIAIGMRYYESGVREFIDRLDADEEAKRILRDDYFLKYAKACNHSVTTLRKNVLGWVAPFIEFIARKKGRTLTIKDFEKKNISSRDITDFFEERKWAKSTMISAKCFIHTFGDCLVDYVECIDAFPRVKKLIVTEREDTPAGKTREPGKPRTFEELDTLLPLLTAGTPKIATWRLPLFRFFALLEICSGARPGQLILALRFKDLESGSTSIDVKGDKYIEVAFGEALKREKILKEEEITSKIVSRIIYVPVELAQKILAYRDEMGWSSDGRIFPRGEDGTGVFPEKSMQTRMKTVGKMAGIPDLTRYDFRHTWASVLFIIAGGKEYGVSIVCERGGWTSTAVPKSVYMKVFTVPTKALKIAEDYKIFIYPELKEHYEAIKGGIPKFSPEEIAEILENQKVIMSRIEELERERK